MSKKNPSRKRKTGTAPGDPSASADGGANTVAEKLMSARSSSVFDSRSVRIAVSISLLIYMAIVLLGPLSNPVGSEFLTRPLAEFVSPAHRALFLGHGYRFFAPDPGPGHLVVYRIADADGNLTSGQFPDRETIWPRLMYHRWFMLSETVFQEHSMTPDSKSFEEADQELEQQVIALRTHGKPELSQRIARERVELKERYDRSLPRIEMLVAAIAEHLLKTNQGRQIELFVQERNLPFAVQVLTGDKLDDEKFLSPLTKIGEFRLNEAGECVSLETLPEKASGDRNHDREPELSSSEGVQPEGVQQEKSRPEVMLDRESARVKEGGQ
jgi:hypothetical protein